MDTPMTREEKEREAVKALTCLTLATDFEVTKDVQTKVMSAISALREELATLQEESRQWEKTSLVEILKERDKLREELAQVKHDCEQAGVMLADAHAAMNEHMEIHTKMVNELKEARQKIQDFIHGKDKLCLVCGAKEPCELKDDPSSPCTFEPTPMELHKECARLQAELKQVKHDYAQLKEAYDAKVAGVPLGPIVGAQTIVNQQLHINKLVDRIAALEGEA